MQIFSKAVTTQRNKEAANKAMKLVIEVDYLKPLFSNIFIMS